MLSNIRNRTFFPDWANKFFNSLLRPVFGTKTNATMPSVNINEDANQLNIEAAAPEMEKKDIKFI